MQVPASHSIQLASFGQVRNQNDQFSLQLSHFSLVGDLTSEYGRFNFNGIGDSTSWYSHSTDQLSSTPNAVIQLMKFNPQSGHSTYSFASVVWSPESWAPVLPPVHLQCGGEGKVKLNGTPVPTYQSMVLIIDRVGWINPVRLSIKNIASTSMSLFFRRLAYLLC